MPTSLCPYWSEQLSDLKWESIECCNYWKCNGSPRSGPIYECKKLCTSRYKAAIREAKKQQNSACNDSLQNKLTSRDNNSFWKSWRNLNKVSDSLVTRVDGETGHANIADAFSVHFRNVYSGHDTTAHMSLKERFHSGFRDYCTDHVLHLTTYHGLTCLMSCQE